MRIWQDLISHDAKIKEPDDEAVDGTHTPADGSLDAGIVECSGKGSDFMTGIIKRYSE